MATSLLSQQLIAGGAFRLWYHPFFSCGMRGLTSHNNVKVNKQVLEF